MSAQRGRVTLTRSEEVRSSNDHIAEQAMRFHFVSRAPMLCECSDPGCRAIIPIGLESYGKLRADGFFTAPAHAVEGAEPALRDETYWLHRSGAAHGQTRP